MKNNIENFEKSNAESKIYITYENCNKLGGNF
jgi:hypothetical protein